MLALLSDRGFAITDREVVLGDASTASCRASPSTAWCCVVDPHDDEDVEAFVRAQIIGFDAPEGLIPITRRVGRGERWTVLLAELHGEIIGSCGIEPYETLSVLIAGAVFLKRGAAHSPDDHDTAPPRAGAGHRDRHGRLGLGGPGTQRRGGLRTAVRADGVTAAA